MTRQVNINGQLFDIERFEVQYQCPKGLTSNLDTAIQVCKSLDLDPDMAIRLVPVAIYEGGQEVIF